MKATELRLVKGNLINTEYGILPVHAIVWDAIQVKGKDGRTLCANKVEPVELTEEWLLKLGFEKDMEIDYRYHRHVNNIAYDIDDNCIKIINSWEYGKRYFVHEIQNLIFALTGEELIIKE